MQPSFKAETFACLARAFVNMVADALTLPLETNWIFKCVWTELSVTERQFSSLMTFSLLIMLCLLLFMKAFAQLRY